MTADAPSPPNPLASADPWNLVADAYSAELLDAFETYSRAALDLAALPDDARVLDVATGPGTLALMAASRGAVVSALDFSEKMLANLRRRAREEGLSLSVSRGDGQALPYEDETFDAAFSMFGLMFFPDKERGFRELHRVLRSEGSAVVSSWAPMPEALTLIFKSIAEVVPGMPFGGGKGPLGDPDELQGVARAAGFRDVRVESVAHTLSIDSPAAFWEQAQRTNAPVVLLKHKMGAETWAPYARQIGDKLDQTLGSGPLEVTMTALCAVATKS